MGREGGLIVERKRQLNCERAISAFSLVLCRRNSNLRLFRLFSSLVLEQRIERKILVCNTSFIRPGWWRIVGAREGTSKRDVSKTRNLFLFPERHQKWSNFSVINEALQWNRWQLWIYLNKYRCFDRASSHQTRFTLSLFFFCFFWTWNLKFFLLLFFSLCSHLIHWILSVSQHPSSIGTHPIWLHPRPRKNWLAKTDWSCRPSLYGYKIAHQSL